MTQNYLAFLSTFWEKTNEIHQSLKISFGGLKSMFH